MMVIVCVGTHEPKRVGGEEARANEGARANKDGAELTLNMPPRQCRRLTLLLLASLFCRPLTGAALVWGAV